MNDTTMRILALALGLLMLNDVEAAQAQVAISPTGSVTLGSPSGSEAPPSTTKINGSLEVTGPVVLDGAVDLKAGLTLETELQAPSIVASRVQAARASVQQLDTPSASIGQLTVSGVSSMPSATITNLRARDLTAQTATLKSTALAVPIYDQQFGANGAKGTCPSGMNIVGGFGIMLLPDKTANAAALCRWSMEKCPPGGTACSIAPPSDAKKNPCESPDIDQAMSFITMSCK